MMWITFGIGICLGAFIGALASEAIVRALGWIAGWFTPED